MTDASPTTMNRRTLMKVAGISGAALVTVTYVAGCASQQEGAGVTPPGDPAEVEKAVQEVVDSGSVAVGQASFLEEHRIIVTHPAEGEYKVFSDVCPHQNGRVTMVDEQSGRLVCVLHGSQFDPVSGEVVVGPSPTGLSPVAVDVAPAAAGTPAS